MKVNAARINAFDVVPEAMQALMAIEQVIQRSPLEASLVELVKMRVSQINGCVFCLDMHSRAARGAGEAEQRIHLLPAWREARVYSDEERAALAWAESLTDIATDDVSDALFETVRAVFTDEQIAALTVVVTQINAWNRIATAFRYQHS